MFPQVVAQSDQKTAKTPVRDAHVSAPRSLREQAPGAGVEPTLLDSESSVLPLDDPGMMARAGIGPDLPPALASPASGVEGSLRMPCRASWCPLPDSNRHPTVFGTAASASWAKRACVRREGFEPPT